MNKKFIPPGMINNDEGLTENDFESDDIQDVISELLSINPDDQEGVNETKPPSPL
jgi:hypothetical protein